MVFDVVAVGGEANPSGGWGAYRRSRGDSGLNLPFVRIDLADHHGACKLGAAPQAGACTQVRVRITFKRQCPDAARRRCTSTVVLHQHTRTQGTCESELFSSVLANICKIFLLANQLGRKQILLPSRAQNPPITHLGFHIIQSTSGLLLSRYY